MCRTEVIHSLAECHEVMKMDPFIQGESGQSDETIQRVAVRLAVAREQKHKETTVGRDDFAHST